MQYVKRITVGENSLEAMQELSHDHWSYSTHSTGGSYILNSQDGSHAEDISSLRD